MQSNHQSKYCYEGMSVLINKFGIRNERKLDDLERKIVAIKLLDLIARNYIGEFDIVHFRQIHKYLFLDIFYFAGEFRNENIAKDNFKFAECEYIESELQRLLLELKSENKLKGYDKRKLANRLAYYMSEINVLHPFREGNGRTYREFIRQLAKYNGYDLNWAKVEHKRIYNATIKSVVDTKNLEEVIYLCLG